MRKTPQPKHTTMRFDDIEKYLLDELAGKLGLRTRTAVVHLAIRRLAQCEGVEVPLSEK